MKVTKRTVLFALFQLSQSVLAQTSCTQSNALQYDDPNDGCNAAALARDDTGCVKQYCDNNGSSASLNACFCLAGGGSNCGGVGTRDLVMSERDAFTCSSSETCYINPADGGLFCLDGSTGDYVGESGDSGNVNTGAYTAANGEGTSAVGATDAPSATSFEAAISSSTEMPDSETTTPAETETSSSSKDSNTVTSSSIPSTRASNTVASTTSSAGVSRMTNGVVVGMVGLVAGLVL